MKHNFYNSHKEDLVKKFMNCEEEEEVKKKRNKVARQEDENDGTVVDISDTVVVFAPIEMSSVITEANIIA
ncbi:hypothetical protein P8452_22957 [Trifolium repens]|nr:hypothetical protein P8452_22957 [Trifolium repens]